MNHKKILASALLALSGLAVSAQEADTAKKIKLEEVVVTSTKFEQSKKETPRTVTVITAEQLENNAGKSLAEVMSEMTALHFDGSYTNYGSNLSYYLRGGRNGQILVMIDGMPVNDPTDITNSFDFRHLSVDQIEKVEIVKGGMSVLYGTDAVAGVINIYTKKAKAGSINGTVEGSAGSFDTYRGSVNLNGIKNKFSYVVGLDVIYSDGISAAADTNTAAIIDSSFINPNRTPYDKDAFQRQNVLLKLNYDATSNFNIGLLTKFDNYDAEIDNGAYLDDENRNYSSSQFLFGLKPTYSYKNGLLEMNLSYNSVNRLDFNDSTEYVESPPMFSYLNGYTDGNYIGKQYNADVTNKYNINNWLRTLVGVGFQHETYESETILYGDWLGPRGGLPDGVEYVDPSETNYSFVDPYATVMFDWKNIHTNAGARANFHSEYGSYLTYMVNAGYLWHIKKGWQLKPYAGVSSAFKAPTLYQLYSTNYGNKDLTPTESVTFEGGLSLYKDIELEITVVYFVREEKNIIDFGMVGYENMGERKVQGLELSASYKVTDWLSLSGYYNNLNSDDTTSLYRIPKDQWGASATVKPVNGAVVSLNAAHIGERTIFDFGLFDEVTFDAYTLLNLYASYSFLSEKKLTIFGSINNLTDQEFISIDGFNIKGRNYTLGARFRF